MTEQEREQKEIQRIKDNSPFVLPDDPSKSGWTTAQIKEKFYAGLLVLYDFIKDNRQALKGLELNQIADINEALTKYGTGDLIVGKAIADEDGTNLKQFYAKVSAITGGMISCLKYLKEDGVTSRNIYQIEKDLEAFKQTYNKFLADNFVNGKAKQAVQTDYVEQAMKDDIGRVIRDTYATVASITSITDELTRIKNGTVIVGKARQDQNGDPIDTTYVKKTQIVNNVTSTSTNAPLSAYQGKVLKDAIDALKSFYLNSSDTDLDQLQEIVTYIKSNKSLIDSITSAKISYTDLVTNYTSNLSNKPLAASVAVTLKGLIDGKLAPSDIIDALNSDSTNKPLSAKQGKALKALIDALDTLKADKSDVFTKEQTVNKVLDLIAGVTTMNVISDEDNEKSYDFQFKFRNGELHLLISEITE